MIAMDKLVQRAKKKLLIFSRRDKNISSLSLEEISEQVCTKVPPFQVSLMKATNRSGPAADFCTVRHRLVCPCPGPLNQTGHLTSAPTSFMYISHPEPSGGESNYPWAAFSLFVSFISLKCCRGKPLAGMALRKKTRRCQHQWEMSSMLSPSLSCSHFNSPILVFSSSLFKPKRSAANEHRVLVVQTQWPPTPRWTALVQSLNKAPGVWSPKRWLSPVYICVLFLNPPQSTVWLQAVRKSILKTKLHWLIGWLTALFTDPSLGWLT